MSELIGRTPLFELAVSRATGTRLFLKLETMNPTGAAKIRMARAMVLDAERRAALPAGGHIIESTSGNTGLGLAVVARERGYRFTAVVDHHASAAKLNGMRAMGAELVFVSEEGDDGLSTSAREERAAELAAQEGPTAYFPAQHDNPANGVGYYALAEELLDNLEKVDILIGAVGTGGSLFGTARGLRDRGCDPRLVGVEPEGSIAFGPPAHDYWQSGTGTPEGASPGFHVDQDLRLIEERDRIKVSDVDAFATARALAAQLGLLIGGSSGSSVLAALERLEEFPAHSNVVVIINDDGEKYLDTVFDDQWMNDRHLLDRTRESEIVELVRQHRPPHRVDPHEIELMRHLETALSYDSADGAELARQSGLVHALTAVGLSANEIGDLLGGTEDQLCLALGKHRQRLTDQAAMVAQLLASLRRDENTHTILMPDAATDRDGAPAK
ncbi:cysteine synthase family protein [Nocardia sp. NPDC059240]|uniref:cysteine synthase family protein n=1 Tax=Nocardia sp. NPDC059240 TaxID=3346786 RepID=UPI0036BAA6FE